MTETTPVRGWFDRRAMKKLAIKIVGLRARLEATKEIFSMVDGTAPGPVVFDLCDLPAKIAELEEKRRQIGTNA